MREKMLLFIDNKRISPKLLKLWYIPFFSILLFPVSYLGLLYLSDKLDSKNKKGENMTKYLFLFLAMIQLFMGGIWAVYNAVEEAIFFFLIFWGMWFFTLYSMISNAHKVLNSKIIDESIPLKTVSDRKPVGSNKSNSDFLSIEPKKQSEVEVMGKNLIKKLNKWKKKIRSGKMKQDISKIIDLCTIVMQRDKKQAEVFFKYYTAPLENILGNYNEVKNIHLNTKEIKETMSFIEESVSGLVVAIRNEVNNMYKENLNYLNADTHLFMENLENFQIIHESVSFKTGSSPRPDRSDKSYSNIPVIEPNEPSKVEVMGKNLINKLNKWKNEIESNKMKQDIDMIIDLCTIVMKRNDEQAEMFFSYYTDPLDNMLKKYDEIENTHLNTKEIKKTMSFVEKSVGELVIVIRNEVNNMYKEDLLHLDADTHVFMQRVRNKGLLD